MDDIDRAMEDNEIFQKSAMSHINTNREVQGTGFCLWCGEPLKGAQRWCNAECRDMWEKDKFAQANHRVAGFVEHVEVVHQFTGGFETVYNDKGE